MGTHKTVKSINFINELATLGGILGYHVRLEFPVRHTRRETQQTQPETPVDIAWFKDDKQQFPLFIIEVESVPANGMAFNPMKIFSKSNNTFEKPLFFFHLVLSRGSRSSKIESLKSTYDTYNYRIYRLDENEQTAFLVDVLTQHRRIQLNLDIVPFFKFLMRSQFLKGSLSECVNAARQLGFNREEGMLQEFATLSCTHDVFVPFAMDSVKHFQKVDIDTEIVNYKSYIGRTWYFPIHCGLICCYSNDLYEKDKALKKVIFWQEKYSYLSMLGPHFGLDSEYDQFLVWGAGGLIGLLSGLFKDISYAREFLSQILVNIVKRTKIEYAVPNLLWLIHVAPETPKGEKYFNFAASKFKELGSFSIGHSLCPPFLAEDEDFITTFLDKKDELGTLSEFKSKLKFDGDSKTDKHKFIQLCFFSLQNTIYHENLSVRIVQYLYQ